MKPVLGVLLATLLGLPSAPPHPRRSPSWTSAGPQCPCIHSACILHSAARAMFLLVSQITALLVQTLHCSSSYLKTKTTKLSLCAPLQAPSLLLSLLFLQAARCYLLGSYTCCCSSPGHTGTCSGRDLRGLANPRGTASAHPLPALLPCLHST